MCKSLTRAISIGAGVSSLLFLSLAGVQPAYSSLERRHKKRSFSNQEADELIARYIPPRNLLTARYMMACQGSESDIKTNRMMLKKLVYQNINVDRLTDEEVNTICYFLGQLTV
jgi:hypothetical protein